MQNEQTTDWKEIYNQWQQPVSMYFRCFSGFAFLPCSLYLFIKFTVHQHYICWILFMCRNLLCFMSIIFLIFYFFFIANSVYLFNLHFYEFFFFNAKTVDSHNEYNIPPRKDWKYYHKNVWKIHKHIDKEMLLFLGNCVFSYEHFFWLIHQSHIASLVSALCIHIQTYFTRRHFSFFFCFLMHTKQSNSVTYLNIYWAMMKSQTKCSVHTYNV